MKNMKFIILMLSVVSIIVLANAEWPYSGSNAHWHTFKNPNYRGPHAYHPEEHFNGSGYSGPTVDMTE